MIFWFLSYVINEKTCFEECREKHKPSKSTYVTANLDFQHFIIFRLGQVRSQRNNFGMESIRQNFFLVFKDLQARKNTNLKMCFETLRQTLTVM